MMKRHWMGLLLCGTASMTGGTAFAQVATPEQPAGDTATAQATERQYGIEDIVVSAQRREQRLQDVPIAVTAVSAESLEKAQVRQLYDLQTQAPALVINRYGNATVAFIRGVGSVDGTPGLEGAVALYIDGVYHSAPFTSGIDFNNIARVEVLKGPQGTLFGRNATGGAIQIITRDPGVDPELSASVSYGNFDTFDGRLYASTPLSDTLSGDVAVTYHKQGKGFGRNLVTGNDVLKDETFSIRSKLVYEPTDRTKVTVTGQYFDLKNSSDTRKPTPGSVRLDGTPADETGGFYDVALNIDPSFHARGKEFSARIDQDLDALKLVSITAYQKSKALSYFDQDGAPSAQVDVRLEATFRTFTQELQLLSRDDSKIKWIVGGFFMSDRSGFGGRNGITIYGPAPFVGGAFGTVSPVRTTSYSAFAEVTVPLGENTKITGGARYSVDKRKLNSFTNVLGPDLEQVLLTIPAGPQKATFKKPTWRAIIDHHFTPDIMAYASISRGFKSGNFNPVAPTAAAYRPEVLTAYEAGIKTDLFDRRVRLNFSGYYYKYDDMQVSVVIGPTSQTTNAGKAELAGAEVEAQFVIGGGFNLNVSGAYAYSKFLRYRDGVCFVPSSLGGSATVPCDHTGDRLPKSPKLTFNVSPSYTLDTEMGQFVASASWYHTSRYRWEPSGFVFQKSYDLVNGRIGWTAPSETYGLAVFVKNATKEKYAQYGFGQALGDAFAQAPPRTYGVEASVKF